MNIKRNGPIPYNGHSPTLTTGASSRAVVMTSDITLAMPNNMTAVTTVEMTPVEISVRRSQSESRSFFR